MLKGGGSGRHSSKKKEGGKDVEESGCQKEEVAISGGN